MRIADYYVFGSFLRMLRKAYSHFSLKNLGIEVFTQ
ncbi:hypothetical protein CLU85_1186 [Acidovorax sp. 69]|nr:hypothetical protein CLU85_1186 [Acidovorax sp. 69]